MDFLWASEDMERKAKRHSIRAHSRSLTPEEREVLAMTEEPGWACLQKMLSERAAKFKNSLYLEDLSGREFLAGRALGVLRTLEWLTHLQSELSERQRRTHEQEDAYGG